MRSILLKLIYICIRRWSLLKAKEMEIEKKETKLIQKENDLLRKEQALLKLAILLEEKNENINCDKSNTTKNSVTTTKKIIEKDIIRQPLQEILMNECKLSTLKI